MGLNQSVAPAAEPLSLAEAKEHLREDGTDQDAMITLAIQAARDISEGWTGRQWITATWVMTLRQFPSGAIEFPHPPLQSITSIAYVDSAGASQTVEAADYTLDIDGVVGRVLPAYGKAWPAARGHVRDVTITYVAGYGAAGSNVPPKARSAMLLLIGHLSENREAVLAAARAQEIPLGPARLLADLCIHRHPIPEETA